jgi:hypothetical protein
MVRENSSVPAALRTYGDIATRAMFMATKRNGGTTVDLTTFKVPAKTDGYFVGKATGYDGVSIESVIIPDDAFDLGSLRRAFGKMYADHLTREQIEEGHDGSPLKERYIGTWADSGLVFIDACNWTSNYDQAVQWGLDRGELAIYDVASNGSLDLAPIRQAAALRELISA